MQPIDIPTAETVGFIQSHVAAGGQIIEVGCGDGEVAFALSRKGYEVIALDSDPERVTKARNLGVRAEVASWPRFDTARVDAIAFARSLHHINPLSDAVDRAEFLLKPKGVLLIEDFAVEAMNERTVNWFLEVVRSEPLSSVIQPVPESFLADLLTAANPMKLWQDHHTRHDVQSFGALHQVIADRFPACRVESVPYLYRYLVLAVPETNESAELIRAFLRREIKAADDDQIALIGRRIVAGAL